MSEKKAKIRKIYKKLEARFGDLHWWPADTPFEVVVGAILTQNTAWTNVEKAIAALKKARIMSPEGIIGAGKERLSECIRPSGYHRVKAGRLRSICQFLLDECEGDISALSKLPAAILREKLLGVNGVGQETADAILLYALRKNVFVVDAYTKRIFARHGLLEDDAVRYSDVQDMVHTAYNKKGRVYNQFHALLVETAKNFCKKRVPLCGECPLQGM